MNVALVSFPGTVTVAGTVAAAVLLLVSATSAPVGAGALRVTVPVDEPPPPTDVGFRPTELATGGVTVKTLVCIELL